MNWLGVNSGAVNASVSSWIIAAAATATAGADTSVTATRVLQGVVFGDAAAVVTLTGSNTIAGRSTGLAEVSSVAYAATVWSGATSATAGATGLGAVLRSVSGSASADGTATGEALAADQLGEASSAAVATAVLAEPHLVRYGVVSQTCDATGDALAVAVRGTTVLGTGVATSVASDTTIQLSGETVWQHESFPYAEATATGAIQSGYIAIIATLGSFEFGTATGVGTPFVRYQAASNVFAYGDYATAAATATTYSTASGTAAATGDASETAIIPGYVSAVADAAQELLRARVQYAAAATGTAFATPVLAKPYVRWAGRATDTATATANSPVYATQHLASAFTDAGATAAAEAAKLFAAFATGVIAEATALQAQAWVVRMGFAAAQGGVTSSAIAFSNIDVLAPPSRFMEVLAEPRGMVVAEENRTMIVEV